MNYLAVYLFSFLVFPVCCYGVFATTEKVVQERFPDATDRSKLIKRISSGISHTVCCLAIAFAIHKRIHSVPWLGVEYTVVGAVAFTVTFFKDHKPNSERAVGAAFVYIAAVYWYADSVILRYFLCLSGFESVFHLIHDSGAQIDEVVLKTFTGIQFICLCLILAESVWTTGILDPVTGALDLVTVFYFSDKQKYHSF